MRPGCRCMPGVSQALPCPQHRILLSSTRVLKMEKTAIERA